MDVNRIFEKYDKASNIKEMARIHRITYVTVELKKLENRVCKTQMMPRAVPVPQPTPLPSFFPNPAYRPIFM